MGFLFYGPPCIIDLHISVAINYTDTLNVMFPFCYQITVVDTEIILSGLNQFDKQILSDRLRDFSH